jgi:hypothetical protein
MLRNISFGHSCLFLEESCTNLMSTQFQTPTPAPSNTTVLANADYTTSAIAAASALGGIAVLFAFCTISYLIIRKLVRYIRGVMKEDEIIRNKSKTRSSLIITETL